MTKVKAEKAEYMREYRARKRAESLPQAKPNTPETATRTAPGTAAAAPSNPALTPGQSPMSGAPKASVEAFLAATAPRVNPNPITTKGPAPSAPGGVGMAAVPIPPALFRFADATLRKVFKKEIAEDIANGELPPDPIDAEQAQALSEGCEEMLAYYKVKSNPAYGFGLMILFWLLPYLLMIPRKLESGKKKKESDANERAGIGLRKHEQPAPSPAPVPAPVPTPVPAAGPGTTTGGIPGPFTAAELVANRDGLGTLNNGGTPGHGKVNPGNPNVSDTLGEKRGSVLFQLPV